VAAGDVALNLIVSASTGAAMSGLQGVGKAISDMAGGGVMGKIAEGAVAVTAGLVTIGVAAVKSAGDFQMNMTKLVTSAGESKNAIGMVSAGILQMSIDTATSTTQLAAGMYYVESAGYHGANGLNVLKVAAMGAKTEGADLDTVSKALTTVMVDYGMKSTDAAKAMNGLIATVQNGKTNLQQLASSMGAVLPIASAMHISFPQVAGAMAAMTNAGMSAQQASQNLAHVLIALESPNAVAAKSMYAVGLTAQQVKDMLVNQGLPQALQLIEDHVGKKFPAGSVQAETALKNIMGGLVGLKLAAMLTGPSLQAYKDDIAKISAAMKDGSGAVLGWSDIQSNFNFKMDQAKEALNVFMIALGTRLIPIVSQVMGAVTPIITAFAGWISKTDILGGVTSAFSKILAMTGIDFTRLTGATKFLAEFGLGYLGDAIQKVAGLIGQILMGAFKVLLPVIGQFANEVLPQIIATFNVLFSDIDEVATAIVNFFTKTQQGAAILHAAGSIMSTALSGVVTIMGQLWYGAEQVIIGIGDVANFFRQNQVAALALLIPLGAIAAYFATTAMYAIAFASLAIPELVAGFVAWATTAGLAAIATLAAAWPILAIGAAIGLVVAGIILAVTHWGAISKWLEGAWSNTANFFKGIWTAIVGFFVGIGKWFQDRFTEASNGIKHGFGEVGSFFSGVWKNIVSFFVGIGKWFQDRFTEASNGIKAGMGAIGGFFTGLWTSIKNTFTAVIAWMGNAWKVGVQAVADAFLWLYNHNYFFQMLCDSISHAFTVVLAWIKTAWTDSISWLTGLWNGIVHIATVAWTAVTGAISAATNTTTKAVQTGWTTSTTWLGNTWAGLSHKSTVAWNDVSTTVSAGNAIIFNVLQVAWGKAVVWLTQQWTSLKDFAITAWKRVSDVFSSIWTTYIVHPLTTLWDNIVSWWNVAVAKTEIYAKYVWVAVEKIFTSAWTNYITKPLASIWTSISGWFTSLATNFETWATNAMTMFASGFTKGTKNVLTALQNLGSNIAAMFGFHSAPPSGPLSTSDQWMPNMCTMMANGITANSPKVTTATTNMATGVNNQFTNMNNQVSGNINKMNTTVNNGFQSMSSNVASNTNNINNSMNGLQSNVTSKSAAINSALAGMSQGAVSNLNNLNGQVQTVSTTIPKAMTTIGSSVSQVTPIIATSTGMWMQDIVTGQKGVDVNSTKAITSVSNAAAAIPKYAEAFQKGTDVMSANAAEGMSKTNQAIVAGGKQTTVSQASVLAAIKGGFDQVMKLSNASEQAQLSLWKDMLSGAKNAGDSLGGILSAMFQNTVNWVNKTTQEIANNMAHSTPKMGPLKGDDEWGEHFMQNIVGGIYRGMPGLAGATSTIASTLAATSSSLAGGIKIPLLTSTPGMLASNIAEGILSKISLPQNRDSDWQQDLAQIHIHLDSKDIGDAVLPRIAKEIHVQAGVRRA
jgi:TP901 family phage tail tape measure protein